MAVIIDPTKLDPKINGIAYQHPSQQCKENRTWTITDANIESQVGESNDCESLSDRCGGDDKDFMKLLAGVAGNILEWYDFAIFGYFGDVIGDVFFPTQPGHAAMVESYLIFGSAFIMRPVGGAIMGYVGDKYGRKTALELSVFLMAFPTFAMGCLPSYDMVGPWAIYMLAAVRILQGLSVGGQLVSSLVFTVESRPKDQWGLYGSYVMATANFGTLLGGVVGLTLRAILTYEQLRSWGWRIPFLSGVLVSLSGFYLKYHVEEDDHGSIGASIKNPIWETFQPGNLRPLLSVSLVPMLWSGGFYLTFVWMAIFMGDLLDPPIPAAFGINSLALFMSVCLLFPLAGILSDWYGRDRIMTIGGVSMGLLSPIMIAIIATGNPVGAFFAQCAMGIFLCLWGAPMTAWMVESFPPAARLTSVAIGYNIAQMTAGGFAPALATFCVDRYGIHSPGYILTALAILSLVGLKIAPPKRYGMEQMELLHNGNENPREERLLQENSKYGSMPESETRTVE